MGQCYTVEAKLYFKDDDPTLFCKNVKEEILKRNGTSAKFDLSRGDLDDPFGCFSVLTRDAEKDEDLWYADFSASYGWGNVIYDIFQKAAEGLAAGSRIDIFPWESEAMTIQIMN